MRVAALAAGTAILVTAGATPAIAEPASPGALSAGDRLFPELGNGGYDARSYDIAFDYRPKVTTMDSSVIMRAVATQNLSQFGMDSAVSGIRSVTVDGRLANFRVAREKLIITPAKALQHRHRAVHRRSQP